MAGDAYNTVIYLSGFDMYAGGKIGWIGTSDSVFGAVEANNNPDLPASYELPLGQTVIEAIVNAPATSGSLFQNFQLSNGTEFSNDSNKTPQILAPSFSVEADGQENDFVSIQGTLFNSPFGQSNWIDYYGVALMAGQTITAQINAPPDDEETGIVFGIFDPAGRLIASTYDGRFTPGVEDTPVSFTATMPGLFEIAVTTLSNTAFTTSSPVEQGNETYELTVTGLGNVGLAGVTATTNIWYQNVSYATGTAVPTSFMTVDNGDLGLIEAGNELEATDLLNYGFSVPDIAVANGNLRDVTAGLWSNIDQVELYFAAPHTERGRQRGHAHVHPRGS